MKMYVLCRMNEIEAPITHEKKIWKEYFANAQNDMLNWSSNIKEAMKFSENSLAVVKCMTKMYNCQYEELN